MTQEIVNALAAKFQADKLKAIANLKNYLDNSAGVGEHPDVVTECEKLIAAIGEADGKHEVLKQLLDDSVGKAK